MVLFSNRHRNSLFSTNAFCPLLSFVVIAVACLATPSEAEMISFDTSDWDHNNGNGSQQGWVDGEFAGTTPIGTDQLTIDTTAVGSTVYTGDHFSRINAAFFTGFAFQLDPSSTVNTTSFDNYARYDFSFSFPVQLDSFTLTDVDRANGQWYDVIAAEGFSASAPGTPGSGFAANYTFENPTNMETFTEFGIFGARPQAATGNVTNTPPNDVTFNFTQAIQSFSIYHWNDNATDDAAFSQTIGIRGNEFQVSLFGSSAVPEPSGALVLGLMSLGILRRRRSCETE